MVYSSNFTMQLTRSQCDEIVKRLTRELRDTITQLESHVRRLQKRYTIVCQWSGVSVRAADAMLDAQRAYCVPCNIYYDGDDCPHKHNDDSDMQLEHEHDTNPNQTAKDVDVRMDVVRWGSLDKKSSMEYLYRLQSKVKNWLQAIDYEIRSREGGN